MIFKNIVIAGLMMIQLNGSNEEFFNDMNKYFNMAKEYSVQGKNILIEQTVLNGINSVVDNTKIKVNFLDINDTTNHIHMDIFLQGEDKNLIIDIAKFQWGVTQDKKYIVFEDFDLSMNIEWMQYIFNDVVKREGGYLKVKNSVALYSLLYSIKPNIPTTYKAFEKKPFLITEYPFDEKYVKIEKLEMSKDMIVSNIWLKGSKNNLQIEVESYTIITENTERTIILKDLKFREFTKPWIRSLIEKQNSEIPLEYNDKFFELLE